MNGYQVITALAMMGHRCSVEPIRREPQQHTSVVSVRFQQREWSGYHEVAITVSDEVVHRGGDVVLTETVHRALMEVVPPYIMHMAGHVCEALDKGPLDVEMVGGFYDGDVISGVQRGADGWPLEHIYRPMPSSGPVAWTGPLDVLGPTATVRNVTYRREFVSPSTLRWRYLFVKDY